jgi:uncharacterized membrane protein YhhN
MMPFPGGIEGMANGTLILSAGAAIIYALIVNTRPTLARSAVKTLAVALLAVLVFVENGPLLLFAALAVSAIGDAFLSREGDRAFLGGLAAFLAAHLLYIALFSTTGSGREIITAEVWRAAIAIVTLVCAVVMIGLLWRRVKPAMRLPILVYVAGIVVMGLAALTTNSAFVISGALLFMSSDGLLAAERFLVSAISPYRSSMRVVVWVFYYAAQLLITLGFILK